METIIKEIAEGLEEENQERQEENLKIYRHCNAEVIMDKLESSLEQTDLIIDGLNNYASQTSEVTAILLRALEATREAVAAAQIWITSNEDKLKVDDVLEINADLSHIDDDLEGSEEL